MVSNSSWDILTFTNLDVFKVKQITLYECVLDLLIGPRDEQLVVMIGLKPNK